MDEDLAPIYNDEMLSISGDLLQKNINLLGIHLRDARQVYQQLAGGASSLTNVFHEGVILLASAALEAHISYWRTLGLAWNRVSATPLSGIELEFLKGTERFIGEDGATRERPKKTSLQTKLEQIPSLLGRIAASRRKLEWKGSERTKLLRMVERRDALLHPRWDRYLPSVSAREAGEALDAVEAYLAAVSLSIHPYLIGYFSIVYTTPPGWHKQDGVMCAYRTEGRRPSALNFSSVPENDPLAVLAKESIKAHFITYLALKNNAEGDSEGSWLTRLALVRLIAMVNIVLSIIAQIQMHSGALFEDVELLYLNEYIIEMDETGSVNLAEDRQRFKQRIVAIPAILARRVTGREVRVDLGDSAGEDLLNAQRLREHLLHSPIGEPLPRVTKDELNRTLKAVHFYFHQLADKSPEVFMLLEVLLQQAMPE